jgi:hypothetical protein
MRRDLRNKKMDTENPIVIEITVFRSIKGPLTKQICIADGRLKSDGSACRMVIAASFAGFYPRGAYRDARQSSSTARAQLNRMKPRKNRGAANCRD